jgi:L,D-peptidoglycan transpeptidase YkuD (ErfK/YbiS/YcfS/YnhG family)
VFAPTSRCAHSRRSVERVRGVSIPAYKGTRANTVAPKADRGEQEARGPGRLSVVFLAPVALVTALAVPSPHVRPSSAPAASNNGRQLAAGAPARARLVGASEGLLDAEVPHGSNEAVLVVSPSATSTYNTVTMWRRRGMSWHEVGAAMGGRDGLHGWSSDRVEGDLESPIGVFGLTAAGGALPNPGTREPYEHDPADFYVTGTFLGHSISGIYDYVVPIDFNRKPGTPPTNPVEPDGAAEGGGIWLHVGNGTATAGCVTVSRSDMAAILRFLDPRQHPVIVMGPRSLLSSRKSQSNIGRDPAE